MVAPVPQRAHLARLSAGARSVLRASIAGVVVALTGCAQDAADGPDTVVTVLAASSLADVLPPILEEIESRHELDVRLVVAASSALARQAEAGAPVDVFFSADERWLDRLIERGVLAPSSRATPVANRLVLIMPADSARPVPDSPGKAVAQLTVNDRFVMGDPAHVPAGRYAKAALEAQGLWTRALPHAVFADNVRAALALVARGEAAFGIVYATDVALVDDVVAALELPAAPDQPVVYALGYAADMSSDRAGDVRRVYAGLLDSRARKIYDAFGFASP